jgi:Mrp family chromosome partitioning ATPase
MVELITKLQEKADVVLVDTPPLLAVSDASVLAARADGVLLVVSAGQTRRAAVQQAVEDLRKVGANVVGGVLNKVKAGDGRGYYYYYSYYDEQEEEEAQGWTGRLRRLGRRFGNRGSQSA